MSRKENEGCRPIDIKESLAHLGGPGLKGALAYIGTRHIDYANRQRIRLYVNGKRGYTWYINITVSVADLYDIELWSTRGSCKALLGEKSDLYFDDLQQAVEDLYDQAIRDHADGVISLN